MRYPQWPLTYLRAQLAMASRLGLALVVLVLLTASCSAPKPTTGATPGASTLAQSEVEANSAPSSALDSPMPSSLGQQLPITAVADLGGQQIFLEVATTPQQQSLGLMYRDSLPDDRGMLFPLGRPRRVSFWMKNVPVALDMVFIYQGTIQAIAAEVPPCAAEPCPTYGPGSQLIDQVIELRSGRAAELGLRVGDAVVISAVEP